MLCNRMFNGLENRLEEFRYNQAAQYHVFYADFMTQKSHPTEQISNSLADCHPRGFLVLDIEQTIDLRSSARALPRKPLYPLEMEHSGQRSAENGVHRRQGATADLQQHHCTHLDHWDR